AVGLIGASVAVAMRSLLGVGSVRRVARRVAPPPLAPLLRAAPAVHLAMLGGAVAVAGLAPHLALLFVAVAVAAWAGYLGFHRRARRPLPVAPLLTLLLIPAYGLLATVAGPL